MRSSGSRGFGSPFDSSRLLEGCIEYAMFSGTDTVICARAGRATPDMHIICKDTCAANLGQYPIAAEINRRRKRLGIPAGPKQNITNH